MPGSATLLLNVTLYQLGWFSCVLGAAWGRPASGALGAALLVGVHLTLAASRRAEIGMMAATCLLGVTVDSLQQALGVFSFRTDPAWPLSIPLWVPVIWAQFATLFHYALRWLAGRYLLAALLGAMGGPLAYGAGIRLGAATFGNDPALSLGALALVWSLITPTLVWLGERTSRGAGEYRAWGKGK